MALNNHFKPKHCFDLIRVGRKNDGGYLIDKESFIKSDTLISLGISDDWSFEEDFFLKKNKKILIDCYDDRLDDKFLLKALVSQLIFILYHKRIKYFKESLNKYFSYKKYKKIFNFFKKKISYGNLNEILKNKNKNIFLKIDIEGSEYRILKDILFNQDKINGLVIEFHNCDLHKDKIIDFINSLKLTLVHIHGNNYSDYDDEGNPETMELSFARYPKKINEEFKLPNSLDMPNNPEKDEVYLEFKD